MRSRTPDEAGEISVRYQLSRFQSHDERPHVFLKYRSFETQRYVETCEPFVKIRIDLPFRLAQNGMFRPFAARTNARGKACSQNAFTIAVDNQG